VIFFLQPKLAFNMRTIAVGDVHGCLKALEQLIAAIAPVPEDLLVFLGDYVDRGPDSRGVIEFLIELRSRCQLVCLLGNHEIMFRSALMGAEAELWLEVGGQQTLESYGGTLANVPSAHLEFLQGLPLYYETETCIFVHANYDPQIPMSEQDEFLACWEHIHLITPGPHFSGKQVYVGHTPQVNGKVAFLGKLTCIDTHCVGGMWLTAIDVDTLTVWQVSPAGQLRTTQEPDASWLGKIRQVFDRNKTNRPLRG
jgi:serine/threonine protein phosphatase 1